MSVDKVCSGPTSWARFGDLYFGIGITPPGQAKLGTISYATLTWWRLDLHPGTCCVRTAVACGNENPAKAHVLERSAPAVCKNCGCVFGDQDLSSFTHGYTVQIGDDGLWRLDVAPYDREEHGPFGAESEELARHVGQRTLAEHLASYGTPPYCVVQYQDGDSIRTEPISLAQLNLETFENLGNAINGPINRLDDALRIAHVATHDDEVPAERDGGRWSRSYREHVAAIQQLGARARREPAASNT